MENNLKCPICFKRRLEKVDKIKDNGDIQRLYSTILTLKKNSKNYINFLKARMTKISEYII